MRLGFAGTPGTAADTLRVLLGTHHTVDFVLTRPDAPAGRGQVLAASAVADLATQHGLPLIKAVGFDDAAQRAAAVDCVVVVAYGSLVPAQVLDRPRHGFLNVHYSLLPRWRGAAPVHRALAAGDSQTGVTVFRLDAGMDSGPMWGQRVEPIHSDDTSGTLLARLTALGATLLVDVLAGIEAGSAVLTPQPATGVTVAPRLVTAEARIDWTTTADLIDRHIRAMTPTPGAWSMCDGERVKVEPVRIRADIADRPPGTLWREHGAVLVGTATHPVELSRVQRAGRSMVPAVAWAATASGTLE